MKIGSDGKTEVLMKIDNRQIYRQIGKLEKMKERQKRDRQIGKLSFTGQ